jgi:hypothetical protein
VQESIREAVGFLCRWCLLGLAGFVVVGLIWTVAMASATVTMDPTTRLVASDSLCEESLKRRAAVWCYPCPPLPYSQHALVMAVLPDGALCAASPYGPGYSLVTPRMHPGLFEVEIKGLPYGVQAFRSRRALLKILPEDRRVYLVDAALATEPGVVGGEPWRDCLREMRRRGEVGFYHDGELADFDVALQRVRRWYPNATLSFRLPGTIQVLPTLRRVARDLNVGRRQGRTKPHIVATNPETASEGVRRGFRVHLLGERIEEPKGRGELILHDSFESLAAGLAENASAQEQTP